jgi:hypothetical protein
MPMIRFAPRSPLKSVILIRGLAGLMASILPFGPMHAEAPLPTGQSLVVGLDQAPGVAQAALKAHKPDVALRVARGMLKADPADGQAHYLAALARTAMDDRPGATKAAQHAFRYAQSDEQRHQAAHLGARLSFSDQRMTAAQFWLRRAVHNAPDAATRKATIRDFKAVRYSNPVALNLRLSVTPSDNVNNGSNSPYNLIDGSPLVGELSPSAQAIAGIVGTMDLRGAYRLTRDDAAETSLTGRLYTRQVRFDDPVPGISGRDISSVSLRLGVSHRRAGASDDSLWRVDITGGRTWYGGDGLYDSAKLGITRKQVIDEGLTLTIGGSAEHQFDLTAPTSDSTVWQGFTAIGYELPRGGEIGGALHFRDVVNSGVNKASTQWTGTVSYTLGQQIGPAEIDLSLGYSVLDYDRYTVLIQVPGGREDKSTFGGVTATFNDWSYLGFVPRVSLRAEKSRSNISRFDVDETSLSLGFTSEF